MAQAVAITGISGNLGRALARHLHLTHALAGIDRRPFPERPKDVELFPFDLRQSKCEELFRSRRFDALIHIGMTRDPRVGDGAHRAFSVEGTSRLFDYCARHGVAKVVLLSSVAVYGPSPGNSNFLTEDAPLAGAAAFPAIRDLVAADMLAQSFFYKYPAIETVILRPVHIVGPTIRNAVCTWLRMERPWLLAGFDPLVQLIHAEDVCQAIRGALARGVRGIYNVVGPGEIPLSAALRELERRPLTLPHLVARPMLKRLYDLRLSPIPPEELDHLRFLCAADGSRAKAWGFSPRWSMRETLRSVL